MIIRNETPDDYTTIFNITRDAFAEKSFSDGTEQYIIDRLRDADALTVSLVAESEGGVVGHVAFSPVTISDGSDGWYGLGPIAVRPDRQHQGIGKALIEAGLARLGMLNANGCVLLGDPNYYGRFGFRSVPKLTYRNVSSKHLQIVLLAGEEPTGEVNFHEAFEIVK